MSNPNVLVLKTDGVNCDMEMAYAFEDAGAKPEIVHVNQLRGKDRALKDYGILAIAGGFSYGDDIASGQVLANELVAFMGDELEDFKARRRPILGICNGFQVLVRTGLLPEGTVPNQTLTLAQNDRGQFDNRWGHLKVENSCSQFVRPNDFYHRDIPMQWAHGEGRLFGADHTFDALARNNQVVFRYVDRFGLQARHYPDNPNGSIGNIAGITDPGGTILGMMPHPERSIASFHPNRSQTEAAQAAGKILFKNIVDYSKES